MNNLSSYCGLVDAKIRPSDKDLPVLSGENNKRKCTQKKYSFRKYFNPLYNAQMRIHLHFAASRGDRSRQPREVKHTYLPSGLECFYWTKVCTYLTE